MIKYLLITFLAANGLGVTYQWYADGKAVNEDEVPLSVQKKCCGGCGCDDSGGGADVFKNLKPFDNDDAATVGVGEYYILSENNTYGLPDGVVKKKIA
jgi:hypothetical protein